MTSKEAVNLFKQYYWKVEDKNKALEILEELVERDTPMKPIIDIEEDIGHCPMCNNIVWKNFWYYYQDKYFCSRCGQRLDWSEWND